MSTPHENSNLNQNMDLRQSDAEVLQKLQQIFGIRGHQDNPSDFKSAQDLFQASLLKLMTQYILGQGNAVLNNPMRPPQQMGLPLVQSPYMTNIFINNFFMNQKNSYNFAQFSNQTINNSIYSQPNLEMWKGLCNQASSGFSQNPLHVCSLEINKENHNNFKAHSSNIKCNGINHTQKTDSKEKKHLLMTKKRLREYEKQSEKQSVSIRVKKSVKVTENNDSPYFNHSEYKTEDSESNKIGMGNRESGFMEIVEGEYSNKEEEGSNDITGHEVHKSQRAERVNLATDNSKEFMKHHFPIVYSNPYSPASNYSLSENNVTIKKDYFQLPHCEKILNIFTDSDTILPKKIWTPNSGESIFLFL
jgi:hypothetical protein